MFLFSREKGLQTTGKKEKPLFIKSLQSSKRSLNSSQFISWKSNLFSVKIDCSRVHTREKFSSQLLIALKICMWDKPFVFLEQSEIENCKTKISIYILENVRTNSAQIPMCLLSFSLCVCRPHAKTNHMLAMETVTDNIFGRTPFFVYKAFQYVFSKLFFFKRMAIFHASHLAGYEWPF